MGQVVNLRPIVNRPAEVTRGRPLIYNIETVDQDITEALSLSPDSALTTEWKGDLLGGVMVIKGTFAAPQRDHSRQIPRSLRLMKSTRCSVSGIGISVSIFASASCSFKPERYSSWYAFLSVLKSDAL